MERKMIESLLEEIKNLVSLERDAAILKYIENNVLAPNFKAISWKENDVEIILQVSVDYFSIGEPDSPIRVPMTPITAQRIADKLDYSLPTTKIVDLIWKNADVKLAPIALKPSPAMISTQYFLNHNEKIEKQRNNRFGLISGHKKDVIISKRLDTRPTQVAIYGWHQLNGKIIQPLSLIHENTYADYSHGVRFISNNITINGTLYKIEDVLSSGNANLISYEGKIKSFKIPLVDLKGKELIFMDTLENNSSTNSNDSIEFSPTPEPIPPWLDNSLSLGERCVILAKKEMADNVHEIPDGSNTSERIREYFKPAYRKATGKVLGITAGNWCAAFACFCARECSLPGETIPHGYYVSGFELEEVAKENGSWRDIELVKTGGYEPKTGDICVINRDDPRVRGDNWLRHVVRVISYDTITKNFDTIGGNEGNRIRITKRNIDDNQPSGMNRNILGFISYK